MHHSLIFTTLGAALTALSVTGHAADAGSVQGQFLMDGTPVAVDHATAFRVRDFRNPRSFATTVILSAQPLDREAIRADDDPYTTAINDEAVRNADYISFQVAADGQVQMNANIDDVQYLDTSGVIMGEPGSLTADCTANTGQRVACTVRTAEPVTSMGGATWSLDLAFDTAILAPPAGQPIAGDGGEPGQALMALLTALEGDDLDRILAYLTPEDGEMYRRDYISPEENLESLKDGFEWRLPRNLSITGGELRDPDTAVLEAEAQLDEDTRMLYAVTMERHDGSWRFTSARPLGFLP